MPIPVARLCVRLSLTAGRRVLLSAGALALLGVLAIAAIASAAPAAPLAIELTQPDGTTFAGAQWGDESVNGVETAAGYTIVRDAGGVWRYAMTAPSGVLAAGLLRADAPVGPAMPRHLRPASASSVGRSASVASSAQAAATNTSTNVGSQPELVILARFLDQAPAKGSTAAAWHTKYFAKHASVRDFYAANSYGAFRLQPAHETQGTANDGVVGWLSLAMKHPNSNGDSGAASNVKAFRMAVAAADRWVNFAAYDTDHNGYISRAELHITVIFAGYEAAYDASCGKSVWAHHTTLGSTAEAASADGVTIGLGAKNGGFTEFGEQDCSLVNGARVSHLASIGILAHEFGHELGLPDLYDTDYSSYGIGNWSLMSLGAWNATAGQPLGSSPSMLDAWSKWAEGWVKPVQSQGAVTVPNAETNASVIQLLVNPAGVDWSMSGPGSGEYFLIENRQRIGYDAGLPGCGLLIWHIDESQPDNHTDGRRLVDLVQADGLRNLDRPWGSATGNAGDNGDPFKGGASSASFTRKTTPNSGLYGGQSSDVSVTHISAPCGSEPANLVVNVPNAGNN